MRDPAAAAKGSTSPKSAGTERVCPAQEWELVQDILRGSVPAWHEFVLRYTGRIRAVLRRQLFTTDADDLRALYVEVLSHLYQGGFAGFAGRCSLDTWVALVARTRAMDFLRSRFGRHDLPSGYAALTPEDREVFRLYYLEGRGLADVLVRRAPPRGWIRDGNRTVSVNGDEGRADNVDRLVDSLQRIEAAIGPRALQRYSDDSEARSVGIVAGRLLQYLEQVRREASQQQQTDTPEALVLRQEVEEARRMVRRLVQRLPEQDRLAVRLWFFRNWGAEELSRAMGLPNRRNAYTVVQRALRRLRRLMLAAGYDPREQVVGQPPTAAPDEPSTP